MQRTLEFSKVAFAEANRRSCSFFEINDVYLGHSRVFLGMEVCDP